MKRNTVFEGEKNRIRNYPQFIFEHKDIRGVEYAFKSLLTVFAEEAVRNHGKEIEIYLFNDSSISIHLVTNRGGLQLGEVASDGAEWKKRLTDFDAGINAKNYNEFLFGDISEPYKTFEPKPCWDSMYKFPMLACNQYVSEFMVVTSKTCTYEKAKSIRFEKGEADGYLAESSSTIEGTYILFKYDSDVFTDVALSKEFVSALAQEMALLYDHVRFVLHMQKEDKSYIDEEYCYAGLDDYIKDVNELISAPCSSFRILESKDEPLGREYTAYVGAAVAFTKDKPSVQCYYNGQRLENGGAFLDELYKCLQEHINYISERACSHPLLTSLTKRELKKHIAAVIDIKTIGCIPDWTDGRRIAINNRMFTDLVRDMCRKEMRYSIFSNEDAVLDLLEIIREERYSDRAEDSFIKKFERAIEDYENGDGKGAFISCLMSAPRDEEGFAALTLPMYKTVCRTETLYYYILMTDYAKFMIPEVYTSLCRLYTESICEDLPEFFEVDERLEKMHNNKGGV